MNDRKLSILLIEDDEDDFVLVRDLLAEVSTYGFDLEWVSSCRDARKIVTVRPHDVYLLDYRLGDCSGVDLLREMIDLGIREPVILLTGVGNRKVDLDAMGAGAADYLVKDNLGVDVLERSLRYALERRRVLRLLENERDKLVGILECMEDRIYIVNGDHLLEYVNPVGQREFGPAEKTQCHRYFFGRRDVCPWCHSGEVFSGRFHRSVWTSPCGNRCFDVFEAPLPNADGTVCKIQILHDITEHQRTALALQESENQLRDLSARLLAAQEEERKRVARELHDSIGSSLSAIKFGLENVLGKFEDRESAARLLQPIISLTGRAIEDSRKMMTDLRPSILDDLGIICTVNWFCREFGKLYGGISVEVEIGVLEEEVPEDLKTVVFRVMQEAFNNIAKYSRAEAVFTSLCLDAAGLHLLIRDTGDGFEPEEALSKTNPSRGFGLTSMKERTELSGGRFHLESTPGNGTTIRATWNRPKNPAE